MRISVELSPIDDNLIILPIHYNRILQGMIYNLVKNNIPEIHDCGYKNCNRTFRLFVFSRLTGQVKDINNGLIFFEPPVKFKIDSPLEEFIATLARNLMSSKVIHLGNNSLQLSSLSAEPLPDLGTKGVLFKAISPISVYSTLKTEDGRKKTYFYHPHEREFAEQIRSNIFKKANVLGIKNAGELDFSINPVKICSKDQKIVFYGDILVKGWMGVYEIKGDPVLKEIAYTCGIGAKNSQGFGMLEILKYCV